MRVSLLFTAFVLLGCSAEPLGGNHQVDSTSLALDTTPTGTWKLRDRGDVSFDGHARFVYHAGMAKVLLVSARPNRGVFSWDGTN